MFDDVTKAFKDGTVALRSISLEVEPGELFVFLGPSGCGKTTLLRTVAGLEYPTEGRIFIAGRDVSEQSPKDRDVAMVFQNSILYPHMTAFQNIAFGVQKRRLNKAEVERVVRRTAAMLEVEHVLQKRPRALSGGEQQRVAIGRAIVRRPAAFLLDEPLSNLDARLRAQMRADIARVQRELGVTTLYVTHDQHEAMTIGDRVGVLRDGVLQQVATPGELYRAPKNLFVAGFIGSPPMNLAEATIEEVDERIFIRFGAHRMLVEAARWPTLRRFAWRQVVAGVRPEDLVDARALDAPKDARMRAIVSRREVVGPDVYLYFAVDAPLLLAEDPREASVRDPIERSWPAERRNVWLARPGSSAPHEGDSVELAIRPGHLFLFDPRTGEVICE